MNTIDNAPRPKRSNWMRVIYNILHDHGKNLDLEEIWDKVPKAMHVPHSKNKFIHALPNMVHAGYLMAYDQVGTKKKSYGLASAKHFAERNAENRAKNLAYKARQSMIPLGKKPVSRFLRPPVPRKATVNGLQGQVDVQIDKINTQINSLVAKRGKLREIRKLAGTL